MPEGEAIASWLQLGFAVAVAWYLLTKAMPRIEDRAEKRDAQFLAAIDKQHVEHREEIEDGRTWASGELRAMRESIERGRGGMNGSGHG